MLQTTFDWTSKLSEGTTLISTGLLFLLRVTNVTDRIVDGHWCHIMSTLLLLQRLAVSVKMATTVLWKDLVQKAQQ